MSMWFLEWEEDREKHEEKSWKWFFLSVCCWIITLIVLYLTEKKLYGEIVETNTMAYLGAAIAMTIVSWRERESLRIEVQKERSKWTEVIIVIAMTALLAALAAIEKQPLFLIQWLCIMPVVYWLTPMQKQERYDKNLVYSFFMIVVALIVIVTTVFVPRLLGYRNVYAAERIVKAEGYEDAEYLGWLYGRWVYQDAVDKSFYEEEMQEEKYYMVSAKKEGVPYRFIIDPKGGEVILAASEKEEPELANWVFS